MSINVGEVIAVRGTQVTLRIFDESSLETMFMMERSTRVFLYVNTLALSAAFVSLCVLLRVSIWMKTDLN